MRGHSVGGFGSVTTNKVIATIAGQVFGKDVQAYPKYGSEKKGLPTTYYLTIADDAHLLAQRAGVRRPGGAQRHRRAVQRQSAGRAGAGRGDLHAVAVRRPGRRVAADSRTQHKQHDPREEAARVLSPTWCRSPARWRREADLQMRMQGIVLLGAFLKLTPYAARAA